MATVYEESLLLTVEEISELVSSNGKPDETLANIVGLMANRFQTDVCSVYLLEPDRAHLVMAATVGLRQECVGQLRMSLTDQTSV
jgi:phosphotransferase system enzyme I (PtsP)